MIGQERLINQITNLLDNDLFPRFSIIVGTKGSCKKTVIREVILPKLLDNKNDCYWAEDIKVATMRKLVVDANKYHNMVFVITDVDNMSTQAKNSLLKVVEECPNNNYFIMTVQNLDTVLSTIKSRCQVLRIDNYTPDEIIDYAHVYYSKPFPEGIVRDICDVPGDVDILNTIDISDFYSYVIKVMENIGTVSGANAFKIADKVALKPSDDGYDLKLFWKSFCRVCMDNIKEKQYTTDIFDYAEAIKITSSYLSLLGINGINRKMLMDNWILDIRKAWL